MEYVGTHKDSDKETDDKVRHESSHASGETSNASHAQNEHPIGIYLKVWLLLFVLSTMSYLVDYFDFQGMLRWTLVVIFMLLKAGFIMAVFMHVMWERMTLITFILGPPTLLLFLIGFLASEGDYTFDTRVDYLGQPAAAERIHMSDVLGENH